MSEVRSRPSVASKPKTYIRALGRKWLGGSRATPRSRSLRVLSVPAFLLVAVIVSGCAGATVFPSPVVFTLANQNKIIGFYGKGPGEWTIEGKEITENPEHFTVGEECNGTVLKEPGNGEKACTFRVSTVNAAAGESGRLKVVYKENGGAAKTIFTRLER